MRWSRLLVSGELASLTFLVVAGFLVVLAGLLWFSTALKDADVVQLQARNLPGAPEKPVGPPRWPYGWSGVVICGFLVLGFVAATLSLPAAVFSGLALLAVAMLAVIRVQVARFTAYNQEVLDKLRAYRPTLTMPYNGHAEFHIGSMVTLSGENRATFHRRDHRRTRISARGREVHHARDLRADWRL